MQNAKVKKEDISVRTKMFALQVIALYRMLPRTVEAQVIGKQILRSGTSVGAQYREGKRARSRAEFLSKLEGALQEIEEMGYWLELLVESKILPQDKLEPLQQEQKELTAILISSVNTAKSQT
jgi:four helix bundle protein